MVLLYCVYIFCGVCDGADSCLVWYKYPEVCSERQCCPPSPSMQTRVTLVTVLSILSSLPGLPARPQLGTLASHAHSVERAGVEHQAHHTSFHPSLPPSLVRWALADQVIHQHHYHFFFFGLVWYSNAVSGQYWWFFLYPAILTSLRVCVFSVFLGVFVFQGLAERSSASP